MPQILELYSNIGIVLPKRNLNSKPCDFTPNPVILLQTLWFYSKPFDFTPNPVILLQTLWFYSKSCDFTPNLVILLQILWFYSKPYNTSLRIKHSITCNCPLEKKYFFEDFPHFSLKELVQSIIFYEITKRCSPLIII